MAQDFRAAFGLGENDPTIEYTDINGINMRAIQMLVEDFQPLRGVREPILTRIEHSGGSDERKNVVCGERSDDGGGAQALGGVVSLGK